MGRTFALAIVLSLLLLHARGEEAPTESAWRVWLEPKFMRAAVSAPIGGAKRTVLTGGTLANDGTLAAFPTGGLEKLGLAWPDFYAQARANAAADLAELKPRYERDSKMVIIYGALESERPIVASAVLAPKFLELFKATLGEKVLVVVPSRFAAFVFPHLASEYQRFSPMIFRAFRATAWPVSVEVFEVSSSGWRCIGAYEEP